MLSSAAAASKAVWLLAGHDLPSDRRWSDVRAHENPTEPSASRRFATRERIST
ncbi:hypothetical protein [Sorangium sp. So ce1389]|uniref:hypothetical protein n=1 Tax=Sorangium sp. So ce1389 TaxID=3133336 RepID=UPI003F5D6DE2